MIWRALAMVAMLVCSMQAQTLKKVATIDLPGPKGERFDYLAMDHEDHWLLSAHLGPAVRQSGRRKPAAVLRKSPRHQIHILLAAMISNWFMVETGCRLYS